MLSNVRTNKYMISGSTSRRTVRTIALIEAAKGILVLFVGFDLLTLLHRDVQAVAIRLIGHLHLNPGGKCAGIFIDAASHVTDKQIWLLAALALIYSAVRLIEGYGLWRERAWAEWIALVSGMIYLPIEIYELAKKPSWVHVSVLTVNLLIVLFIALVLWRSVRTKNTNKRPNADLGWE